MNLFAYDVCRARLAIMLRCVQVSLMAALPCAQAAMDAHRGVAAVAEHGLRFLMSLSAAEANRVSWWACLGHPWCTSARTCLHVFRTPSMMLVCCLQVPLMAVLPCAQAAMDAHRGVAAVAEQGLGFLANLAFADANRVS